MRAFCAVFRVVGVSILLISASYGQAIIQHAVAAAGGSVAGVGGKAISDAADKIFGKVNQQLEKAAATGQAPEEVLEPPVLPDGASAPIPATLVRAETTRPPSPVRQRAARAAPARPSPAQPLPEQPWQSRFEPSLKDLTGVESGLSRGELVARLGSPMARVTIPDHGELRELYLFSGAGHHLGTVELTDGSVRTVKVNEYGY